ncbi:MAG: AAA family ATPase, partial [Flammeovirgaceae bacterium]
INFSTLIGSIQAAGRVGIIDEEEDEEDMTMVNTLLSRSSSALRKQITVLAIKLNLVLAQKSSLDLETLDAVEKDQLNLCKDISSKYGGYLAGGLSNHILVYFGYPEVHDTDARRAGRTALELITDARKRSALLEEAHGIRIELRTAIHSGTVLVLPNQIPEGNVPNTAFELLYQAESGSVLASSTAKKLLEPFLDFELAKSVKLPNEVELVPTYALLGERQSEALSALKSWSIQRDMIGREKETSLLSEYWRKAQQGIQAVVLNGQAGIGKSRLTHEVKKYVQANGHVFRESRCLPEQQNSALSPFLNMLRRHWGLTGSESAEEEVQRLAEVLTTIKVNQDEAFPVLCSWFSLPLPAGIKMSVKSPDEQKGILFEILKECVITIDVDKPFLLIVEDLHWIDPTSQEFIEFLLKAGAQAAMMLLMTTRPTEVAILPEVPVISLEPLTDSAIETMIKSVLRNAAIAPKAVHYIVERTDGIPLFVEELTNMLLEQRYLTLVDQQYELVADIEDKAIPITLQALLNAKLDRLGFAKETAQLAATIGREFGYDLLVKASVKDEAMVQSDLNQLIEADLVFHQRRINEDRYLFRHALIGDAAYSGMTQSRQKEVHQTLAESLETYFPTTVSNEPFTVARHWAGAQSFGRATDYGIKTIQKLVASSANQEALGVNEEVIHWISQMGDGFEKYKNELVLNENMLPVFTLIQGWGSEKIETVVKRNNELIASLQSYSSNQHSTETASFLAKSEWMLLSNYLSKAEDEKVLELGERILKRLETNDDHQLKMAVSLALGQTYLNISKFAQAKILLELVIRESKAKNDLLIYTVYGFDPCVHAYGVMTVVHYMSGDINKAVLYAQESIDYALKVNSTLPIGTAYVFASLLYAVLNKPDKVKSLIDEVYETHTDKLRNSTSEKVLFILQDWANEETERSSEILEAIINAHQTNSSYWYEYLLVTTFIKQGKYKTAQKWLLRCIDRADDYAKPFLFRLLASSIVHEKQELSVEAISYFKMSIQLAQAHHTYWLELHTTYEYFILMDEQNKNWMVLLERMKTLLNKTSGGEAFELYQHVQKVLIKHGKDD